ncbi:hypothetical protein [Gloeobacter kilaueensis]|uniref:Uncharacterized protein n=1 Tax=Gloeobacter kilaueensis (strain ATCC BAA-2537 / CCAP 1431/1 / ULC 316 / JS1) TaxID=1183438 RepID=U5QHG1_GLOK1|nr:hypothetical protein [Gloeobacter kilaueensis]AGY57110.1 hypothetical protein GKIL_0864 [Gloeobacter kilaueensis JS1]
MTVIKQADGSIRISEIVTKPNGSDSSYLAVGIFQTKTDEFGDISTEFKRLGYPDKMESQGIRAKKIVDGKYGSAQQSIQWTILMSPAAAQKYSIALVRTGSGYGGRRPGGTEIVWEPGQTQNVINLA